MLGGAALIDREHPNGAVGARGLVEPLVALILPMLGGCCELPRLVAWRHPRPHQRINCGRQRQAVRMSAVAVSAASWTGAHSASLAPRPAAAATSR